MVPIDQMPRCRIWLALDVEQQPWVAARTERVDRMRQLLTILLVIVVTMVGTSALFVAAVVVGKETVRAGRRIAQRWVTTRRGEHPNQRTLLHVLGPLR